jgi:hypothetical protein
MLRGLSIFLLVVSTVLAIVALFLNIAVHSGLNDAQTVQLAQLRAKNREQCNETLLILDMLSSVQETLDNTTVDTMRLPQLQECEAYVRARNPALMNASDVRLMELLEFNDTTIGPELAGLLPDLSLASQELNVLNRTGEIKVYQVGTVVQDQLFNYSIRSITLGNDSEFYYVNLPRVDGLLQVAMNMTSELLLDNWVPAIGSGCPADLNCTRADVILDRQQEKIMTVPVPIMFDARTYPNGTNVLLKGNADVMVGSFIGIADAAHLSF